MALEVGPGPRAMARIQAMGIDTAADGVTIDGPDISFRLRWREETLTFRAVAAGEWLIGEGEAETVPFRFALRRLARGKP
jgi:hypothetical protein